MDTETDIIYNRISTLINDIPGHTHQDKLNNLNASISSSARFLKTDGKIKKNTGNTKDDR